MGQWWKEEEEANKGTQTKESHTGMDNGMGVDSGSWGRQGRGKQWGKGGTMVTKQ